MKRLLYFIAFALVGGSVFSACQSTTSEFKRPDVAGMNQKWKEQAAQGEVIDGWIKDFNDPNLEQIVNEAILKNFNLQAASANLNIARHNAVKAGALLKPVVGVGGGAGVSEGIGGNGADAVSKGVSLDISWELDLWGRMGDIRDSASLDFEAKEQSFIFARRSLAAQTAKSYFLCVEALLQRDLAGEIAQSFKKMLNITEMRHVEGLASKQDIHLIRADMMRAEEALVKAENAYKESLRSLELILGRYPSADIEVSNVLPELKESIPVGLPSEVLERRPDIIAAAKMVEKSFKDESVAKKAKLPRIALTSSVGYSSTQLSDVLNLENTIGNLAANLLAPIYDGGVMDADIAIATESQKAAVANYNQIALKAFAEVENAISSEKALETRALAIGAALSDDKESLRIAQLKYDNGAIDMLSVLQLKIRANNSAIDFLTLQNARLMQRVNLHLALGGDFE